MEQTELEQGSTDEIKRMLTCPPTYAIAVSEQMKLLDPRLLTVSESDVDKADGFAGIGVGPGPRPCQTCNGNAKRSSGAGANPFCERASNRFAHGS
jgi:hypothetical protein